MGVFNQEIALPREVRNAHRRNFAELWFLPVFASLSSLAILNNFFKVQIWGLLSVWICLKMLNFKLQPAKGFAKIIVFVASSFAILFIISYGYHVAKTSNYNLDEKNLITVAGAIILFFFCTRLREPQHINNLIQGCIIAFYAQLFLGLIEAITGLRLDSGTESYRTLQSRNLYQGYSTTLGNPNDYVYFILIGFVLSVESIFRQSRIRVKTIFIQIAIAAIVLFFILANDSRAGLICFALVAFRFLYLLVNNKDLPLISVIFKVTPIAIVSLCIFGGIIFFLSISNNEANPLLDSLGFTYGDYERGFWLIASLSLLGSLPFFGLGPGVSYQVMQNLGISGSDLHFSSLQLAYDFGIIVSLLFLSILILIGFASLLADSVNPAFPNGVFSTPLLLIALILFVWTIGSSGAIYQPTFWVLLALGSVIATQKTVRLKRRTHL
jgi:hypothetical protein